MNRKMKSTGVPPRELIDLGERTLRQAEMREGRSLIPPGGSRLDRFEQRPRKFPWKARLRRWLDWIRWPFCCCNQLERGSHYNRMLRTTILLERFQRCK